MGKGATVATAAVCIISLACSMLGAAFIWLGIHGAMDHRAVMSRAVRVPGTITGKVSHTYGRSTRLSTFSRFRFKTLDGRTMSHIDEFPDSYNIGDRITVVYDPLNLRAVYINDLPPWTWKTTVIAILVGGCFFGVGAGPLLLALFRRVTSRPALSLTATPH